MSLVLCVLIGGFIGWAGSLLMRTGTTEGILIDITVGALSAIALALLLANETVFDNMAAAYLGAVLGLGVLYFSRRVRGRKRPAGREI